MLIPIDIHTHDSGRIPGAVVSGDPGQVARWIAEYPDGMFSVGIHPWSIPADASSTGNMQPLLYELEAVAADEHVVAIGETGLDSLRGAPMPVQEELLRRHIALSESLRKPLVLHTVRTFNHMIALRREYGRALSQPWIFHGFRGKPQLAAQLLASGTEDSPVLISFGERFNPLAPAVVPPGNILVETDESQLPIGHILEHVADARGESPDELHAILQSNVRRVIGSGTAWATSL